MRDCQDRITVWIVDNLDQLMNLDRNLRSRNCGWLGGYLYRLSMFALNSIDFGSV